MAEVLLLAVRFDDDDDDEGRDSQTAVPHRGVVTISHPCGRRFVVAEITDRATGDTDGTDQDEDGTGHSIW